jgi:hypothetical protein
MKFVQNNEMRSIERIPCFRPIENPILLPHFLSCISTDLSKKIITTLSKSTVKNDTFTVQVKVNDGDMLSKRRSARK